jgi:hypothetical protein
VQSSEKDPPGPLKAQLWPSQTATPARPSPASETTAPVICMSQAYVKPEHQLHAIHHLRMEITFIGQMSFK